MHGLIELAQTTVCVQFSLVCVCLYVCVHVLSPGVVSRRLEQLALTAFQNLTSSCWNPCSAQWQGAARLCLQMH